MEVAYNKEGFVPRRLKEARLARGYTLQQLAELIGVTRQSISKYELGQSLPSKEILYNSANILGFPIAYFYKEYDIRQDNNSAIYFRSLKSATKKSREMSVVRTVWVEEIVKLLEKYIDYPTIDIPDFSLENESITNEDIDRITLELREYWGLGNRPVSNIVNLLEKKGFIIIRLDLDEKIDAFSQWKNGKPYIFLGNESTTSVRSRFDVAHELGHLILHPHIDFESIQNPKILDRIEWEANKFASSFLLPKDAFVSSVMSCTIEHFIFLKKRWKVSIAAMIYRCQELQLFDENRILNIRKQMSYKKMKMFEPLDDIMELEQPRLLNQSIRLILENGVCDSREIINEIKIPIEEIEKLCNLPKGLLDMEGKIIPLKLK